MVFLTPRMLIFSGPKYSSAGASIFRAANLAATIFAAGGGVAGFLATAFTAAPAAPAGAATQEATTQAVTNRKTRFTLKWSARPTRELNAPLGRSRFVRQRKVSVACVQVPASARADFDASWPAVLDALRAAARSGAGLVILPEATVPGYFLGEEPIDSTQVERAEHEVAAAARE